MRIFPISTAILALTATTMLASSHRDGVERSLSMKGFKGRVSLHQLADDKIEVRIRTWRTSRDTVRGHEIFPVLVNGHKQSFFLGRFGSSKMPMLIFAVSDPDRINESRTLSYQIAPSSTLIGQQVVVDEAIQHSHSDELISGRYPLAGINPEIGAIYSIAYQDAHFEGFFVSYEKLRVRQWDPNINAFIETDQGFLREKNGRLIESTRFHGWPDRTREAVFAENLVRQPMYPRDTTAASKATPVATIGETLKR